MLAHVEDMYSHYGESHGVRIARKHIGWYSKGLRDSADFRITVNRLDTAKDVIDLIRKFYNSAHEFYATREMQQ